MKTPKIKKPTRYLILATLLAITLPWTGCKQTIGPDLETLEYDRVMAAAERYLREDPVTITAYGCERSQGGRHDFYSEGDYWWPDPENPEGPYIRRDGQTNPENFTAHRIAMRDMSIRVPCLVAAFKLTGDRKYALHALAHLKAWFTDSSTMMNPNLLYGQAIKGRVSGRGIGIIDTIHLIEVARSIAELMEAGLIPEQDAAGLLDWFRKYNTWLTTHPYGVDERDHGNNHSAWWTAQVAAFADLTGDESLKDYCREHYKTKILPGQLDTLGRFSDEITRTKPYSYSLFNLEAFALICELLSTEEEDLWDYRTSDGKSTRLALDFLYPYWKDKSGWPFTPDIEHFDDLPVRGSALLFAGIRYQSPEYIETWEALPADSEVQEIIRTFVIRQPLMWVD